MVDFRDWAPKSFLVLRQYSWHQFAADLLAGVTVGLVALPLAMAFAIASGVPPQLGLYCAVIAGFLISALGGSSTQIGGPTGAFVVVVFGIVTRYGIEGLVSVHLDGGHFPGGAGRDGAGVGGEIYSAAGGGGLHQRNRGDHCQHADQGFFWLEDRACAGRISGAAGDAGQDFGTASVTETALGVSALVIILFCVRHLPKIPGYIVALFLGTFVVWALKLPVETIGTRFGGIPAGLPTLNIPAFHFSHLRPLIRPGDYSGDAGGD